MSLLRNRAKSAGTVRKASMTNDVLMLQDTIFQLEQQLVQTRMENKKVKDQLNCLITLVKQAWCGDRSAVLHVANIVGVAVPEISEDVRQNHIVLTAKPKSRAVNNWARLTIALLNHEYRKLEEEVEERQRHYLRSRQQFLESQIERGYAAKASQEGNRAEIRHRQTVQPPPTPVQNGHSYHVIQPDLQPDQKHNSAKKKPTIRHLYRPANQNGERCHDLGWTHKKEEDCLLNKLNHQKMISDYCDRQAISYIDPHRYDKGDLFSEDSVPFSESLRRPQRPISGKLQRESDSLRARPKSAVLPKGQRPLKYETTRPVSVPQKAAGRRQEAGQRRPQSCKQTEWNTFVTSQTNMSESCQDLTEKSEQQQQQQQQQQRQRVETASDSEENDSEAEAREQRRREAEALLVKIKLPESIQKFQEDLANMEKMQNDFKSRTLSLQKKLGINPDGLIS